MACGVNHTTTASANPSNLDNLGTPDYGTPADLSGGLAANQSLCDYGGRFEVNGSMRVHLSAINEPPVIHTNGPNGPSYDVAGGAGWSVLEGLSFTDPDAMETRYADAYGVPSDPMLTVTLSAARGRMSLRSIDGLAFSAGDGLDDPLMRFQATLADLNHAVEQLRYRCSLVDDGCVAGADTISVHLDDNGYSGAGGALETTAVLEVAVAVAEEEEDGAAGGGWRWHDSHLNYEARDEPERAQMGRGDTDYWDS